jgi:hypothetical protein
MTAMFKSIVTSRVHLAAALLAILLLVASAVTFGSWAVGSDPGNGYAKAVSATNLTLGDASASTVADLYPGGTGAVKVAVTNPNAFAVTITSVTGAGTITSNKGASCDAATGVTFTNTSGLSQAVGGGATVTFSLAGKAAMSSASDNSCQGAVFTIPVTLVATT